MGINYYNHFDNTDALTVDNDWGTDDHEPRSGHGTLWQVLLVTGKWKMCFFLQISYSHKLCSVKFLPRPNQTQTPRELWGDLTAQSIARAEIQNPNLMLVYCMSVTSSEDVNRGRPSSWSGAIDNLTFGEGQNQRLIIISGGNIRNEELWRNYPNSNLTSSIHNPAQSWNAIVAGAYTNKVQVNDPDFQNHLPVANEGQLSPFSSTSLVWEQRKWPIKPLVFEGGNLLRAPDDSITPHEDLELLSTSRSFNIKPFDTINATSAERMHRGLQQKLLMNIRTFGLKQ